MRMPIELRGGRRRAKEESEYEDDGEVSDEPSSPDEAAQEDDDDDYEDWLLKMYIAHWKRVNPFLLYKTYLLVIPNVMIIVFF